MFNKLYSKRLLISLVGTLILLFNLPIQTNAAFQRKVTFIKFKTNASYTVLAKGSSKTLKVNIVPLTAKNKKLTWTTSNPAVVSVESNGSLTGVNIGKATVTAQTTDGSNLSISREIHVYTIAQSRVKFIAHRGFSSFAPENTLAAFSLAGDFGFWGAECDIWETHSGNLYVMHDYSLLRMCGIDKPIVEIKPKELKRYSIVSGKNLKSYPDETIPTFEEYLEIISAYPKMHPVIELKNIYSKVAIKKLIFLLERYQLKDRAYIISPFRTNMINLRSDYQNLNLQYVSTEVKNSTINFCIDYSLDLCCHYNNITTHKVKKLHDNGLNVNVWTVDSKDLAYKYISKFDVDFITTNKCLFLQ